jgi:predicted metal-dependent hydrolase
MSCDDSPPPQLVEGIAQFNRGEFFEQHEALELLWRAERRDIRYLYQGILQIGVAFHHLHRLNHHGTVYMLTRGPRYVAPFAPRCQRVAVAACCATPSRLSGKSSGSDRRAWKNSTGGSHPKSG